MNDPRRPELVLPASARTAPPPLPTFVEHGGELACRHPADAINTRLYGFVLQADRELLDAYCDRCFNRPPGDEEHWTLAGGGRRGAVELRRHPDDGFNRFARPTARGMPRA